MGRHVWAACAVIAAVASGSARGGAYDAAFDFDGGLGFYAFKNGESTAKLSSSDESILPDSRSLKLEYKFAGGSAWVGIGIDTASLSRECGLFRNAGDRGAAILHAKADRPTSLTVILVGDDGSYSSTIKLRAAWGRYTLPLSGFARHDGETFAASGRVLKKIEMRPARTDKDAYVLIDEIGVARDVDFTPRDTSVTVRGVVRGAAGETVAGAHVEVMVDHPKVHGWWRVHAARTAGDGRFGIDVVTARGERYAVDMLEGGADAQAAPKPEQPARNHLLRIALPGSRTHEQPLELAAADASKERVVSLEAVDVVDVDVTAFPGETKHRINPFLYGSNVGLWHSADFGNPAVVAAARASGTTIIRYPGGARSQGARWQRQEDIWCAKPRSGPGNCVLTPKSVAGFMEFCRKVGAEPMFSLNVEQPDLDNIMDMVRFLNEENSYEVKYFELGNEPEAYAHAWGIGDNWTHDADVLGRTYRKVAKLHREYTRRLKGYDPCIVTLGPVSANADFFDLAIPPFWKIVGSELDVLTVHRYPQCDQRQGDTHFSDARLLASPDEWEALTAKFEQMRLKYSPERRPLVAVTEWHTSYHSPGARQQQTVGALYIARSLCEMAEHGVDIANVWVLTGCGPYNLFNLDARGELDPTLPYQVFRILANNYLGTVVRCESGSPELHAYAAVEGRGMVVALVNTSPTKSFRCRVSADGKAVVPYASYTAEETRPFSYANSFGDRIDVPAYSLCLVKYWR